MLSLQFNSCGHLGHGQASLSRPFTQTHLTREKYRNGHASRKTALDNRNGPNFRKAFLFSAVGVR